MKGSGVVYKIRTIICKECQKKITGRYSEKKSICFDCAKRVKKGRKL